MSETQLDRFEKKFDRFVEYVQGEFAAVRQEMADGLTAVRAEVASLRNEMRQQFETVTDRLTRLEHSYSSLNSEAIRLGKEISKARSEIDRVAPA